MPYFKPPRSRQILGLVASPGLSFVSSRGEQCRFLDRLGVYTAGLGTESEVDELGGEDRRRFGLWSQEGRLLRAEAGRAAQGVVWKPRLSKWGQWGSFRWSRGHGMGVEIVLHGRNLWLGVAEIGSGPCTANLARAQFMLQCVVADPVDHVDHVRD